MNSLSIGKKQTRRRFIPTVISALISLLILSIPIKSNSRLDLVKISDESQTNKLDSNQEIQEAKKPKSLSSIKFLDPSLNEESENQRTDKEKESSINQITRESRILQATPTGTQNNNTSTGVPTPNATINASSSVKNGTTVFIYPKCLSDADCSGNGICDLPSGVCTCKKSFISIYDNKTATISKLQGFNITYYDYSGQKSCNYDQKKQLTAFMLSIFVGFGAEHFYLERNGIAIAKLVFYIFCGFLNILYLILYKCVPGGEKYVTFIHTYEALYLGCGVAYMLLWNIYDWVNIGFNDLKDGNNVALSPWGL